MHSIPKQPDSCSKADLSGTSQPPYVRCCRQLPYFSFFPFSVSPISRLGNDDNLLELKLPIRTRAMSTVLTLCRKKHQSRVTHILRKGPWDARPARGLHHDSSAQMRVCALENRLLGGELSGKAVCLVAEIGDEVLCEREVIAELGPFRVEAPPIAGGDSWEEKTEE